MQLIMRIGLCLLLVGALAHTHVQAQGTANIKESAQYKHWEEVYRLATYYSDGQERKTALLHLAALDPEDLSLKDSLSYLYFNFGQYAPALLIGLELLKVNPKNTNLLEMSAICYDNLGVKDKALEQYEKLYLINNNTFVLYRIAFLQLGLQRPLEAQTNVDILMKAAELETEKVVFPMSNGAQQEVVLKAAVQNLQGLIYYQTDEITKALESFTAALQTDNNFTLPQQNIALIRKEQKQKAAQEGQ